MPTLDMIIELLSVRSLEYWVVLSSLRQSGLVSYGLWWWSQTVLVLVASVLGLSLSIMASLGRSWLVSGSLEGSQMDLGSSHAAKDSLWHFSGVLRQSWSVSHGRSVYKIFWQFLFWNQFGIVLNGIWFYQKLYSTLCPWSTNSQMVLAIKYLLSV